MQEQENKENKENTVVIEQQTLQKQENAEIQTDHKKQELIKQEPVFKKNKKKKRFQIDIFNKLVSGEGANEHFQYEKVHYDQPVIIEASSKKDLDDFAAKLAICQQTFKIVRMLDDIPEKEQDAKQYTQQKSQQQVQYQQQITQHVEEKVIEQPIIKQKPKFYKIGDIEIKNDNGKIYQKQWLKLTEAEMSNFRIINNKTNAVVTLKDRSIEMKKWVLVETSEDISSSLEEYLK